MWEFRVQELYMSRLVTSICIESAYKFKATGLDKLTYPKKLV